MNPDSSKTSGEVSGWDGGALPAGVRVGTNTLIKGKQAFRRFVSGLPDALIIGSHATMDGVQFSIGPEARISIGDYCCFTSAVLMAEELITIGNYVLIGWNTVIADSDFHPIAPADRIADAVACSPAGAGKLRPPVSRAPVVIEDDVWIGPNCAIFKGVRIGRGAWVGPGSVVTRDVPPGAAVAGNPARRVDAP